jgi:cell cycle sensor histidine kinase DivJ
LSSSQTRTDELLGALAAGCDRLVHHSVAGAAMRLRHGRFIAMSLAAPLLLAGAVAMLFPPHFGAAVTLYVIAALFGGAGAVAVVVAATGRLTPLQPVALAAAAVVLAAIVAAAGGPGSPVLICILALPFEAYWLGRTPRAAATGALAALAVIPLQALLGSHIVAAATVANGWHWLAPLAYAAFVVPRLAAWEAEAADGSRQQAGGRLEDIMDAVVLRLSDAGDVIDASSQARQLLGVAPELLLSSGLLDRVHVGDRLAYLCALTDLRHGAALRRVELRLRLPAGVAGRGPGDYRPFALELMRPSGAGEPLVAIVRANDEVAGLRASLAASKDNAESIELAKSRFLAAVSHELRTPLNAIIGFSDMLLHEMFGTFGDPRQKEYVGLVRESGRHLLDVVNSILDVSRIESGAYATNPEPFSFRDAARMCHSMLSHLASNKKLSFALEIAPELGEVHADRRAVQQILINLVSNAIKFTPEGGSIALGAKRIGSRLHFWVSDTGIGMSAQDLAQVGKPFRQVQNDYTRRFEGTGLGLSLVKGLVSLHDGTMAIESEPGGGTTVTISLPVDGPKQVEEPAAIVAMPVARRKEEDDGTLRKTA